MRESTLFERSAAKELHRKDAKIRCQL